MKTRLIDRILFCIALVLGVVLFVAAHEVRSWRPQLVTVTPNEICCVDTASDRRWLAKDGPLDARELWAFKLSSKIPSWEQRDQFRELRHAGRWRDAIWSRDAELVLLYENCRAQVHDGQSSRLIWKVPMQSPCQGAYVNDESQFSPDGRVLALVIGESQEPFFYDARTGRKLWTGGSRFFRFTADSRYVVSLNGATQFVVHDIRSGEVVRELASPPTRGNGNLGNNFYFSLDGKSVISGDHEGRTWRIRAF